MSSNPEIVTTESAEDEHAELLHEEALHDEVSDDETFGPMSLNASPLDLAKIKNIVEAALMAAGQPLSVDRLLSLFLDANQPSRAELQSALATLAEECATRGVELVEVGSGFRYQSKQENAEWIARLWEEKPARYSRALLETLALIAYRQPITRGEIEDIRGVSVSTNIMKTLMERDWVKVVGHRDVPGKPAMYASTKQFLDYFSLKSLSDLPTLAEIRDIDSINAELDLTEPGSDYAGAKQIEDGAGVEVQEPMALDAEVQVSVDEEVEAVSEEFETEDEESSVVAVTNDESIENEKLADAEVEELDAEANIEMSDAEQKAVTAADPA